MAWRSIGMQVRGLSNKNLNYFRSALLCAPAGATWDKNEATHAMSSHQFERPLSDFSEHFYKNINKTCFKRCAFITDRCHGQNEAINQIKDESKNLCPNLDLKVPIRKVAPVLREIKNASYISPEFMGLLRKHDEQKRQKYILNFLPQPYAKHLGSCKTVKKMSEIKPYCICEKVMAKAATAAGKPSESKKRKFFKSLNCCAKADSAEDVRKCQCAKGKQGECEMCSQSKKSSIFGNLCAKSKENIPSKDEQNLLERYWVGSEGGIQEYVAKQEKEKQSLGKQKPKKKPRTKKKS